LKHVQLNFLNDDGINESGPDLIEATEQDSLDSPREKRPKGPVKYKEYSGAVHIHTTYSDGDGTFDDVVDTASRCGLDFILMSDHDTIQSRMDGKEGWRNGMLVLAEQEVSPREGHCLVIGADELIEVDRKEKLDVVFEQIKQKGGHGFAAHPYSDDTGLGSVKYITWDSIDDNRLTGIELWSFMIDWTHGLNRFHLKEMKHRIDNPQEVIKGPPEELIAQWDRITQKRRMPVIGSLDAHGRKYFFGAVTIFPYELLFNTIRTHILAEPFENDLATDRQKLYDAIIEGRCFIAYDYLQSAEDFSFRCFQNHKIWVMGQELEYKPGLLLEVSSPHAAELYMFKDGVVIDKNSGVRLETPADGPGVYRVEAKLEGRPWVYTNPIYIRDTAGNK
jgi:hypothetical protein